MNLPNMDWKPIETLFTCTPVDHPEYILPYGQTIIAELIKDKSHSYCLNRRDANPFLVTNGTEDVQKTWTQWVNTLCFGGNDYSRRCLGSRPDDCVVAEGKYILLNMI